MSNHHWVIGIVINQMICRMGDVKCKWFYQKPYRYYTLSSLLRLLNVDLTIVWDFEKFLKKRFSIRVKFKKAINNSIRCALKWWVEWTCLKKKTFETRFEKDSPSALFIADKYSNSVVNRFHKIRGHDSEVFQRQRSEFPVETIILLSCPTFEMLFSCK